MFCSIQGLCKCCHAYKETRDKIWLPTTLRSASCMGHLGRGGGWGKGGGVCQTGHVAVAVG